jgi:2-succinyl-6-hydroxy-2,4-cyclohexadiene-1-carboxylate synthase
MTQLATRHGSVWVRTFGAAPAPVVALHGFTLHGGMFATLAGELGMPVAAPDLPGHGRTAVVPITMETTVAALAELLEQYQNPPLLLGYSQGGRIALHVAIQHPDLIGSLVLVSASPGLSERARKLRTVADDGLATRIEKIGTERFISEWLANPLTTTDRLPPAIAEADRQLRLENDAAGLGSALRGLGQAAVADSRDQIAALPMRTAFVAGRRDEKYASLAAEMAGLRSERPVLVGQAGHNVILEAPAAVASVIRDLLGH